MGRRGVVLAAAVVALAAYAQPSAAQDTPWAYVDGAGILRWEGTDREVCLFGVNYYAPCSVDYVNIERIGGSHEQAIDEDLHHLARMGVDVIRLHVFDREISDAQGNLTPNRHLELLDYLIARAAEHDMRVLLTPIAWWWTPVPGTTGFSNLYTKGEMVTNPTAIEAQRTYLSQFMGHVNPLRELAYGQDPTIVAVELINEPVYDPGTTDEQVVLYVNDLADAVRETGAKQPILYNVWQGREAIASQASIDGCTFGWYPTNLCAGHSQRGNFLPAVQQHPQLSDPALVGRARVVYEYDAADVPGGYLYAPMARAFRTGGVQIAAQFQYDPLATAAYNSDWGTHYLSLPYAPRRAVGFTIAGEVFRRTALFAKREGTGDGGAAGDDETGYDDVTVSYETDTVVLNTPDTFMSSGDTETTTREPKDLTRIVGYGSSPLVKYQGTGAYFLDRVEPSLWRLEVYPDAVWVRDPFSPGDPYLPIERAKPVARIFWRDRPMTLALPGLDEGFAVQQAGGDRDGDIPVDGATFVCRPGVYLVRAAGREPVPPEQRPSSTFIAPPHDSGSPQLWHEPRQALAAGQPWVVEAALAAAEDLPVTLQWRREGDEAFRITPMAATAPYHYGATIPAEDLAAGRVTYWITAGEGDAALNWPGGWRGAAEPNGPTPPPPFIVCNPGEEAPEDGPVFINGSTEECACRVVRREMGTEPFSQADIPPGDRPSVGNGSVSISRALRIASPGFAKDQLATVRYSAAVPSEPTGLDCLEFDARSVQAAERIQVALVEQDGTAWGADMHIGPAWRTARVPLDDLQLLWGSRPRRPGDRVQLDRLSFVQVSFGWWDHADLVAQPCIVEIDQVRLASGPRAFETAVAPTGPLRLFSVSPDQEPLPVEPLLGMTHPFRAKIVAVGDTGRYCERVYAEGFGDEGILTFRTSPDLEGYDLSAYNAVRVRARGLAVTKAFELSLVVADGRGWGHNIPLTPEWQDIIVPLTDFGLLWGGQPREPGETIILSELTRVQACFGAWLFGEDANQTHGIEVEEIALVHEDAPQEPAQPAE